MIPFLIIIAAAMITISKMTHKTTANNSVNIPPVSTDNFKIIFNLINQKENYLCLHPLSH